MVGLGFGFRVRVVVVVRVSVSVLVVPSYLRYGAVWVEWRNVVADTTDSANGRQPPQDEQSVG